jgi:5-methylcytosine-specific restriction endonuclease McrA
MVEHPKIRRLTSEAFRLYMRAVFYAFRCRTDGFVDEAMLRELATLRRWRRLVDDLRDAALIHEVSGGYEIHDYLDHQPTKQEVAEIVEKHNRRQRQWARAKALERNRTLRRLIRKRDGDHCRYCGVSVNWRDRRGTEGATYDHVDPDGDNSLENLVVACRGCNAAKQDYPLETCGLVLRPPPNGTGQVRSRSGVKTPPHPPQQQQTLEPAAAGWEQRTARGGC